MPINYSQLFTRVRALADIVDTTDTFTGTDLPADLATVMTAWSAAISDPEQYANVGSLLSAVQSFQKNTSVRSAVFSMMSAEVIRQVQAVYPSISTISRALARLFDDMIDDAETVKENVVSVTPTTPTGRDQLLVTVQDGYLRNIETIVAETLTGEVNASGSVVFRSAPTKSTTAYDWPGGSGISNTLTYNTSSVASGSFDLYDSVAGDGYPDDWSVQVGVIGTSLDTTTYETQTVVISGTPASGFYTLNLTDAEGRIQTTDPISWDGDEAAVQSAINALEGWESVSVSTAGTSPNYTHTLTFTDVPGTVAAVTAFEQFNTGAVTINPGAAADATAVEKKSLKITGDGAELTRLSTVIDLQPVRVYAIGVRLKKTATATGVVRFRLLEPDDTVLQDYGGNNNEFSVNLSAVSSSAFGVHTSFFRTPATIPDGCKLEIALTTAINSGQSLYIDQLQLWAPGTLKNGAICGLYPVDRPLVTEEYTLVFANNYAGRIQTLWMRAFDDQLPSDTSGSETISDT